MAGIDTRIDPRGAGDDGKGLDQGYEDPGASMYPARGRRLWSSRTLAVAVMLVLVAIGAITFSMWRATDGPPRLLTARQAAGAASLDGAVYVVGGVSSSGAALRTVESLGESSSSWQAVVSLPQAVHHPAVAALGGSLYVFGGFSDGGSDVTTDAVQVYDVSAGTWRLAAPMPVRLGAAAAVAADERIYVMGGTTGNGSATAGLMAYDPSDDSWETLPPMPTARQRLAAGFVGGRVHALGGFDQSVLAAHEAFDLARGEWLALAPLPAGRAGHAAAVSGGCLVVAGGESAAGPNTGLPLDVYSPAGGTWTSLAGLGTSLTGVSAATLTGGDVLLIGGAGAGGAGAASAEVALLARPECPPAP